MAWVNLRVQVWWEFQEAQQLVPFRLDNQAKWERGALHESLTSIRRAYQQRNIHGGKCRSCPRPLSTRSKTACDHHMELNRQRAARGRAATNSSVGNEVHTSGEST